MAISLGDINFALGADVNSLTQSMNRLKAFGKEVEKVSRSQVDGAEAAARALRKQEAAMTSALQKTLSLNAAIRRAGGNADLINKTNAAFNTYVNQVGQGAVKTLTFQRAQERLNASLGDVNRTLADIKSKQHEQTWGRLAQSMQTLAATASFVNGPLGGVASRITALSSVMRVAGTAAGAMAIGFGIGVTAIYKLGEAIIANARKINVAESAFMALGNSTEITNRLLEESRTIANRSGQSFVTVAQQYSKFLAAAQGTALAGKQSADIFDTVAQTVGKLQLPAEQAEGVFRALEQMMSKGQVQAEELRGQLGDRLPGAFQIMARALGVSTAELNNMLKSGQVLTADALPKFAAELKKTFNLNGDVDNFQATINRVGNSWSYLLDELDKTFHVSDIVKAVLNATVVVLDYMRERIVALRETMQEWALGFEYIIGALLKFGNTVANIAEAVYEGFKAMFTHTGELFDAFTQDLQEFITNPLSNGGFDKLSAVLDKGFVGAFNQAFDKVRANGKTFNDAIDAELMAKADAIVKQRSGKGNGGLLGLGSPTKDKPGGGGKGGDGLEAARNLAQANLELVRMNQQIEALEKGGVPALEKLNEEFAKQDKIKQYADLLAKSGLNAADAAAKLDAYKASLDKLNQVSDAAKNTQAVIDELQQAGQRAFDRLGDAIGDMVSKGKLDLGSLADVSRQIAGDILKTFIQLAVVNPLKNMIFGGSSPVLGGSGGIFGAIFGASKGAAFSGGRVTKMASGGLLTSPTMIGTNSGPVLGGEAGTEAIMPLKRTATGDLGVVAHGGRTINQTIVIQTPNPQAFKSSETQIATQMRKVMIMGARGM